IAEIDRKQYTTAENYINQSLEKAPGNPASYVQLGNLKVAQNKLADAQKAFQTALDQEPNSTDALGGVLNVYLVQKQTDKAIAVAKAQIAKSPNNSSFHVMLGRLLEEQNKSTAEAEFQKAADLDKKNAEALLRLGIVQSEQGKTDQALQTYL